MRRSTLFALLSVTLFSVYLRLVPVTQYLYWGADFGEYFGVTRTLAMGSPLPDLYLGWGLTYPEFPGLNVLVSATSWAGVDLQMAAVLVVPILAGLVVIPVFLLTREVTGKDGPALIAAGVVAVAMPHVYTTSHPIPGALGDLLLVSSLLLVLRLRASSRALLLLVPLSLALVFTHHLSGYFLTIVTFMIVFLRVVLTGAPFASVKRETGYLAFLMAANLAHWTLLTESFREYMGFERIPWWVTAILLLALPLAVYPLALLRRRYSWRYRPSFPAPQTGWKLYLVALGLSFPILVGLVFVSTPGTTLNVTPELLLFAAPVVAIFMLGGAGRRYFDFMPGGGVVTATFLALAISWAIGGVFAPTFLIPYRHLEYVSIAIAIFVGVGAISVFNVRRPWRVGFVALISALLVLAAVTALPPREALGNHFEGVRPEAMDAVQWASQRVGGITASDHRASSVLFGFAGVRATWDVVSLPLHAPTFDQARPEMEWVQNLPGGPGRIDYVLLDADMVKGATILPWDPALPISQEAREKFVGGNYLKLYDDGYSQIYWVNWGTA